MKTHTFRNGNVTVEVVMGIVALVGVVLGILAIKSSNAVGSRFDGMDQRLSAVEGAVGSIQSVEQRVGRVESDLPSLKQEVAAVKEQLAAKPVPAPVKSGTAAGDKKAGSDDDAAPTGPGQFHTIKQGDTFGKLAARYKTTSAAIEKLNPSLNPSRLKLDAKVRVK